MRIKIHVDASRRRATFQRDVHPMHAGDLEAVGLVLDEVYREARDWINREVAHRERRAS